MDLSETLQIVDQNFVISGGERLAYFGGCDYYRLSSHPDVVAALRESSAFDGLSAAASRITTGNHPVYLELEKKLARFFGSGSALTVSAGYLANLVVAQALAGQFDHAFIDDRSHASLQDASRFLECPVTRFSHRDAACLSRRLEEMPSGARAVILTDGMFSHDGSVAPLRAYDELLPRGGLMLVDDSHGAGVLGESGRGAPQFEGVKRRRLIQTATLSKAFGSAGGVALCSASVRQQIVGRSAAFQGSTPLAIPLAQAGIASLGLLRRDKGMRLRLQMNVHVAKSALMRSGVAVVDSPSPIIAHVPRSEDEAGRLVQLLRRNGVYPTLIKYPGGPPNGYFRFAISSEHSHEQIKALTDALVEGCEA